MAADDLPAVEIATLPIREPYSTWWGHPVAVVGVASTKPRVVREYVVFDVVSRRRDRWSTTRIVAPAGLLRRPPAAGTPLRIVGDAWRGNGGRLVCVDAVSIEPLCGVPGCWEPLGDDPYADESGGLCADHLAAEAEARARLDERAEGEHLADDHGRARGVR